MDFELEQKVEDTLGRLEDVYGKKFKRPAILYDLRGRMGGMARCNNGVYSIRINREALHKERDHYIKQTVPHEVAHIAVFQLYPNAKAHGYEWKRVMRALGLTPSRCHTYELTPTRRAQRYEATCSCRTIELTSVRVNRMRKGTKYFCTTCKGNLTLKGETD
jgi:SprT protein